MKKAMVIMLVILMVIAASACKAQITYPEHQEKASEIVKTVTQAFTPAAKKNDTAQDIVSRERAIDIALQTAGVDSTQAYDIDAELDRERGYVYWEVDFETRDREYSYDINAYDGSVLKTESEFND